MLWVYNFYYFYFFYFVIFVHGNTHFLVRAVTHQMFVSCKSKITHTQTCTRYKSSISHSNPQSIFSPCWEPFWPETTEVLHKHALIKCSALWSRNDHQQRKNIEVVLNQISIYGGWVNSDCYFTVMSCFECLLITVLVVKTDRSNLIILPAISPIIPSHWQVDTNNLSGG